MSEPPTPLFVFLFFAVCTFLYTLESAPHGQGVRAWAGHVGTCVLTGLALAWVFEALGLFTLSGIDPNAGQFM